MGLKARALLPAIILSALAFFSNGQNAQALTIVRDFVGGVQGTNDTGTGNLVDIFNAAADLWEQIILDDHVLTLHYGWSPNGGGEHQLNTQGGTPNRETEGTIMFNNDAVIGHHHYYLDPTPSGNEEFPNYTEIAQDMGGGALNVTRLFSGGTGDAGSEDLLTVALHEIGHSLGLSMANASFITDSADGAIDITAPRPYLRKRNIKSTSSALAAAIVTGAMVSAPSSLAASIATSAMGAAAASATTATSVKLLQSVVTAKKLVLIGTATALVFGTIASMHLLRAHPALLQRLHRWLMQ